MFVNVFAVESFSQRHYSTSRVLTVVTFKNCIFFKWLDFWGHFNVNPWRPSSANLLEIFFINVKLWQLCCNCDTTTVVLIKWLKFYTDFFLSPLANIKLLFLKTKVVLGYPLSIFFIVVNEFCERFSYYGMRGENPPHPTSLLYCSYCFHWYAVFYLFFCDDITRRNKLNELINGPVRPQLSWCCTSRTSWTGTKTWPPPFITSLLHFATWLRSSGLSWPTHGWENTSERLSNVSIILHVLHSTCTHSEKCCSALYISSWLTVLKSWLTHSLILKIVYVSVPFLPQDSC